VDTGTRFAGFDIDIEDDRRVGARVYPASGPDPLRATLVLGHGAGAGQQSGFMTSFATSLSARGIDVVTFNFLYIEARRRVPDANALLETTWRRVIVAVRQRPGIEDNRLFIGGKSMGGRIASQVAADPEVRAVLDGLVFLGYPLHPPGQPERRRDAHLGKIARPMLFVQGEHDTFGNATEMRALVAGLPAAELYVVSGANHSLAAPKRAGTSQETVFAAVQDHIVAWMRRVPGREA
jgi:uncharacterized protein